MNVIPLIPREQAALLDELKAHDEASIWHLISLYPTVIDALGPDQIKPIAAKMAMILSCFAIEAGRRDRNTEALIDHIIFDLLPLREAQLIMHSDVST